MDSETYRSWAWARVWLAVVGELVRGYVYDNLKAQKDRGAGGRALAEGQGRGRRGQALLRSVRLPLRS